MTASKPVIIDRHPGRNSQTIGIARELGTDPDLIHEPSVGVVGTKGDSQCYMGVMAKVDAIHASLKGRVGKGAGQLKLAWSSRNTPSRPRTASATVRAKCALR